MTKVFEGVASLQQTFELFKRHDGKSWEERADPKTYIGEWWETTEEAFWYFLEILPPIRHHRGMFQVCEAITDGVYGTMIEISGRYFYGYVAGRKSAMEALRLVIMEEAFG